MTSIIKNWSTSFDSSSSFSPQSEFKKEINSEFSNFSKDQFFEAMRIKYQEQFNTCSEEFKVKINQIWEMTSRKRKRLLKYKSTEETSKPIKNMQLGIPNTQKCKEINIACKNVFKCENLSPTLLEKNSNHSESFHSDSVKKEGFQCEEFKKKKTSLKKNISSLRMAKNSNSVDMTIIKTDLSSSIKNILTDEEISNYKNRKHIKADILPELVEQLFPTITYTSACQKFYSGLCEPYISYNWNTVNQNTPPSYSQEHLANIVQGWRYVKEYKGLL